MRELELLEQLIAFPTVSDQSNMALINWAQALLQDAGFQTVRIPSEQPGKVGLHATLGPRTDGGLCLSAHTDVVPVAGQAWTRNPFKLMREGANLYGRGATDMKGFVACALAAAERAAEKPLQRPFSLVLSYDEEVGCLGIREMLPQLKTMIGKPEIVVVGEPTSMQIGVGHKGKTTFAVACHGQAGHSAMAPKYQNAIHLAARFIDEIRELQRDVAEAVRDSGYGTPYSTLHIGKINGGRALNIVPDITTMDMEIRYLAQASIDDLIASLHEAARRACELEGCVDAISIEQVASYPGLDINPEGETVSKLQKALGLNGSVKVDFGTEAGFFAMLGLKPVVFGPGSMTKDGHKPDESVALDELVSCASALDGLINQFAG